MDNSKLARIEQFKRIVESSYCISLACAVDKLDEMDYFTAPASTKYHGSYIGGLFHHSVEVTRALLELTNKLDLEWEKPRSPYIIGMLHDLCKCDSYAFANHDAENPLFTYRKELWLDGHGSKSVILAQTLIDDLTLEEIACIRWHMGAFDDKENWNYYNEAIKKYPNVLYTHTADMIASKIIGI